MAELRKKQEDYLEERKKRIAELEELIQRLRTSHTEEFNALKLRLTTEVQVKMITKTHLLIMTKYTLF